MNVRPAFDLSVQEQAVIDLSLAGFQSPEIAQKLHMAERTVKARWSSLYRKAGITSASGRKKVRLLNLLPSAGSAKPLARRPKLTPRQLEIIRLTAQGLTNREIALQSRGTELTVKNKLRDIYDLCGVWTRYELALWWKAHGREFQQASQ
jgi:DNA-binding NarL/FixJ family response regulator